MAKLKLTVEFASQVRGSAIVSLSLSVGRGGQELSNAQNLQIESATIKHFKASMNHDAGLREYAAVAFAECIGNIIKLMTKRGVEAAVLILTQARRSYGAPTSPS